MSLRVFNAKYSKFKALIVVLYLFLNLNNTGLVYAQADYGASDNISTNQKSISQQVEDNTIKIILKEIEMEKLNLYFRLNAGIQGRFKGIRYFITQEANYALTEFGLIQSATERLKNLHVNHHPNRAILKDDAVPQMIGPIIASAGSALEFTINAFHQYQAYKKNLSPGVAKKRIYKLRDEINELFKIQKQLLIKESQDKNNETQTLVAKYETVILADLVNLSIIEYHYFHMDTRKLLAFQQSLYLLDIAKNTLATYANYISYRSELHNISQLNQSLGILNTISGSLIVLTPIAARLIGKAAYRYHEEHLDLPRSNADDFNYYIQKLASDRHKLLVILASIKPDEQDKVQTTISRVAFYGSLKGNFRKELSQVVKEQRKGVLAATENVAAGVFTGNTKIANGVLTTIAGTYFSSKPYTTNDLLASGATTYIVGNSFAMIDNIRIQCEREWQYHKRKRTNKLPNQQINSRLDELDAIYDKINSTNR